MTTNSIQRYYQEVEKLKQRGGTTMESTGIIFMRNVMREQPHEVVN
jgi:predicted house-cleaning NTP pyrophosphatase (Maf/HAM1 superfamily)